MKEERTHVDLFTGIAGFSLAARANGVRTIAMCEADARCQAFLAKAWPGVPVWPDVRTFSLADARRIGSWQDDPGRKPSGRTANRGIDSGCVADTARGELSEHSDTQRKPVEGRTKPVTSGQGGVWLLTAGVPCQPASRAGKQGGASDDRWLWPAAVSVFAALRPAWGLFENPPGIGDVGLAGILSDLGREGYAVRVFSVGACALGSPHRRMRYWIVCKRLDNSNIRWGRASDALCSRGPSTSVPTKGNRVGQADSCQPGCQRPDTEPGAKRLHPEYPESQLADAVYGGECKWARSARRDGTETIQCRNDYEGGVGDTKESGRRAGLRDSQPGGLGRDFTADTSCWQNYVWLPCADGKVRRAPDSAVELVDGRPVDIIETLAKEGWPHRSVLGALGNSIVWQVAAKIISAMVASEEMSSSPVQS